MTTPPVFPSLPGQGWSVHKKPKWSTIIAPHVSGREVRYANYEYPLWEFEATFDGLDSTASGVYGGLGAQSLQSLTGLFLQSQGQFGTFLYTDPTDNSATAAPTIPAGGTGAPMSFSFARTLGGFSEPVGWVTSVSAVYLGGAQIPSAGFSAPAPPGLSSASGGALSGATYYVKITYVTASGETLPSSEVSLTVASSHLLNVASPAAPSPASATGWNVYVSTSTGTETLQNAAPTAIGTNWTEPTSGLISGAALPSANTTGWALSTPNLLVFVGNVANGVAVTATFDYAFECRFDDDKLDFEQFMSNLWKLESLKFRSVRTS